MTPSEKPRRPAGRRSQHETEAKFKVGAESTLALAARLRQLGPFRRVQSVRERQWNQYWDTPDLRLRWARAVLKVRRVGRRTETTFKRQIGYQDGVSERIEITSRRAPFREPIRQARRIAGARLLQEVVTMQTDRRRRIFTCGRERIELDLDRVRVLKDGRLRGMHRELELENLSAGAARFREALADLRRQLRGRIRISRVPKYETALRLLK